VQIQLLENAVASEKYFLAMTRILAPPMYATKLKDANSPTPKITTNVLNSVETMLTAVNTE